MAKTSGPPRRIRVLTKKRDPEEGLCILVENGVPCAGRRVSRGLCHAHLAHLRKTGRLEEFALPRQPYVRHTIHLKPDPEPGICRVIVNGTPCMAPAQRRGLCIRHYAGIWQRSDLDLDTFCLPPLSERIGLKREILAGTCRIREDGVNCEEPVHARGLCRRHYRRLASQPDLFERFALPERPTVRYSRRERPRPGRCRVAEDGVGCAQPATVRGLCRHHLAVLRNQPDLFESIALPPRKLVRRHFARAADAGADPTRCVVLENGVRCTKPPLRRGLCRRHHRILGSHADYSLHDFYLPEAAPALTRKPPGDRGDGLCLVVEDGVACENPPHARGLCQNHYRRATKAGLLEELALPSQHIRGMPYGAGNDRPHGYLDKNVLYDHADHVVFGASGQGGSVALIERVRAGDFRASINLDAVKSTYNHVRYRLQRPADEGGREASEAEAEETARAYVRTAFFGGGAWRFIPLDPASVAKVVTRDDTALSLEDALEFQAYQQARSGKAAPAWFVTRDTDFPEGVHPAHLASELGWV